MSENNHKVAVIGLDGATFDLLIPWVNQGKLPNFKRLMNMGCWGHLESTLPPLTPPAWTSFITGKNPGKHGVFDFIDISHNSPLPRLVNSKTIGAGKVWNYLSSYDKKCIILNVPLTYPPEFINGGVMVTGMLTPPNKPFTYPEDLAEKIRQNVGEYLIDADTKNIRNQKEVYLKDLYKTTELRTRCAKYLLHNYPWDFFMMVYTSTDRLQHRFWGNREVLLDYYIKLDEHLSELLIECFDRDVTLIFVSDHGFRGIKQRLYLNKWLEKEGYISSKQVWTRKKPFPSWKKLIRNEQKKRSNLFKTLLDSIRIKRKYFINWKATRAYYSEWCIYINTKNRNASGPVQTGTEYETLRDEIIGKLGHLESPFNGKKVFNGIYKKENVYNGPHLDIAPDILLDCGADSMVCISYRHR